MDNSGFLACNPNKSAPLIGTVTMIRYM